MPVLDTDALTVALFTLLYSNSAPPKFAKAILVKVEIKSIIAMDKIKIVVEN